jgi:hypothetical protein
MQMIRYLADSLKIEEPIKLNNIMGKTSFLVGILNRYIHNEL